MSKHFSVASAAVLATLTINQWSGRKFDKQATAELTASKHASKDAARVNKLIVSGELIGPVKKHLSKVRAHFYKQSLPWTDKKARVLPATKIMELQQFIGQAKTDLDALLQDFLRDYAYEVQSSHARLGDLFNPDDYPSTAEIASKYSIGLSIMPVPTEDDFRVNFTADQADAIRASVQRDLEALTANAVRHIWATMGEMLTVVRDRLRSSDGRFTSIFSNLSTMIEDLGALNVTNDPQIAELQAECEGLLTALHDPKELKKSKPDREATADEIDDVLKRFEGMWA